MTISKRSHNLINEYFQAVRTTHVWKESNAIKEAYDKLAARIAHLEKAAARLRVINRRSTDKTLKRLSK